MNAILSSISSKTLKSNLQIPDGQMDSNALDFIVMLMKQNFPKNGQCWNNFSVALVLIVLITKFTMWLDREVPPTNEHHSSFLVLKIWRKVPLLNLLNSIRTCKQIISSWSLLSFQLLETSIRLFAPIGRVIFTTTLKNFPSTSQRSMITDFFCEVSQSDFRNL